MEGVVIGRDISGSRGCDLVVVYHSSRGVSDCFGSGYFWFD